MENRSIIITCLVLIAVICLVMSCVSIIGASVWIWNVTAEETSSIEEEASVLQTPVPTTEENLLPQKPTSSIEEEPVSPSEDLPEPTEAPANPENAPPTSAEENIPPDIAQGELAVVVDDLLHDIILEDESCDGVYCFPKDGNPGKAKLGVLFEEFLNGLSIRSDLHHRPRGHNVLGQDLVKLQEVLDDHGL